MSETIFAAKELGMDGNCYSKTSLTPLRTCGAIVTMIQTILHIAKRNFVQKMIDIVWCKSVK